jgi:hypothetical protein
MKWDSVKQEHIVKACQIAATENRVPRRRGLFIVFGEIELPAKEVMRIAYCLANGMSTQSPLKFASGEGTLNLLRSRGFAVKRRHVAREEGTHGQ